MADYRVNLEIYNGPLDLLLYLIRRDEVDIHDIPIARITGQYLEYVDLLKGLDPNLAGEFLVMAATLMEIKTRMLLPSPSSEDEDPDGVGIDPRAELVRQLLEYKSFKDAAVDLRTAHDEQADKFPRPVHHEKDAEPQTDLEDVQVWDLLDAFNRLMTAIGADAAGHEIIYDDTPLELHATDILHRLRNEGPMTFASIFEGRTARSEIVGLFLAMLELIRRKRLLVRQSKNFKEIHVELNPDPPAEDEQENEQLQQQRSATGTPGDGRYISEPEGYDDDDRDEDSKVGL
ncbi:MAG: segregation and condensation protein A [Planctomycetota bacterium]|jgi:segregation and condensation protein A